MASRLWLTVGVVLIVSVLTALVSSKISFDHHYRLDGRIAKLHALSSKIERFVLGT